jgi:hypothetical protein
MAQRQKRQSSRAIVKRLTGYPVADWLQPSTDPDEVWSATQEVDFPTVTRIKFVNDLHALARRESLRLGRRVRVMTTTKGLPENTVEFRFDVTQDPLEPKKPKTHAPVLSPEIDAAVAAYNQANPPDIGDSANEQVFQPSPPYREPSPDTAWVPPFDPNPDWDPEPLPPTGDTRNVAVIGAPSAGVTTAVEQAGQVVQPQPVVSQWGGQPVNPVFDPALIPPPPQQTTQAPALQAPSAEPVYGAPFDLNDTEGQQPQPEEEPAPPQQTGPGDPSWA